MGLKCSKGKEQILESHARLVLLISQNRRKFRVKIRLDREKLEDLAVSCLEITKNNYR